MVIFKPLFIMENVRSLFLDSYDNSNYLEVKKSGSFIDVTIENSNELKTVTLNRLTAIRLVRELKKQIGNLKTYE